METKDPWGDGEDPGSSIISSTRHVKPTGKPANPPVAARLRTRATHVHTPSSPVPSLMALCLGVLALHLEELIECGDDVLPHLPAAAKASLRAAARRRRELNDAALRLLADPEHVSLTVRGASPHVTSVGILTAARKMARSLRYIDLRGVPLRPRTLSALAEACPGIEVLWFGEFSGGDDEALSEALLGVLPRLEPTPAEGLADDWEAAVEAAEATGSGRFMHLTCVVWPEMPHETKRLCEEAAPAVAFNPSPAEAAARRLPPCCREDVDLDSGALEGVAGQEAWVLEGENRDSGAPPPPLHIAEKFRLAFESQDKRLQKRDRRLWRKATREVLQSSGGERAIREWEYGF